MCTCVQFKEIAAAYEILSDEKKRKVYDEHGEEGLKEGAGDMHNPMDIFDMFFGGSGGRRRGEKRTKDMVHPLRVSHGHNTVLYLTVILYVTRQGRIGA